MGDWWEPAECTTHARRKDGGACGRVRLDSDRKQCRSRVVDEEGVVRVVLVNNVQSPAVVRKGAVGVAAVELLRRVERRGRFAVVGQVDHRLDAAGAAYGLIPLAARHVQTRG